MKLDFELIIKKKFEILTNAWQKQFEEAIKSQSKTKVSKGQGAV